MYILELCINKNPTIILESNSQYIFNFTKKLDLLINYYINNLIDCFSLLSIYIEKKTYFLTVITEHKINKLHIIWKTPNDTINMYFNLNSEITYNIYTK